MLRSLKENARSIYQNVNVIVAFFF